MYLHSLWKGKALSSGELQEICSQHQQWLATEGREGKRANLSGADLREVQLPRVVLQRVDLSYADLSYADLSETDLQEANISHANLYQTRLTNSKLKEVKGAPRALHLETVVLARDVQDFDKCERKWYDRELDWERFRTVGRLPLFTISYSVLILIPIIFSVFALYNSVIDLGRMKLDQTLSWLETLQQQYVSDDEKPIHIMLKTIPQFEILMQQDLKNPENPIPKQIEALKSRLKPWKASIYHLLILVSTVLLAAASTLYTIFCPSRIKEFSRDQWCDLASNKLIHYWALAWKRPVVRVLCAIFYTLGGGIALGIIFVKVWGAASFIIRHLRV